MYVCIVSKEVQHNVLNLKNQLPFDHNKKITGCTTVITIKMALACCCGFSATWRIGVKLYDRSRVGAASDLVFRAIVH